VIAVFRPTRSGDADAVLRCVRILRAVQAVIERRGFCPTGEGGGIDNSCATNKGGGGGANSGSGKRQSPKAVSSSKDASVAIADEVKSWVMAREAAGYDMSNAPSQEEIAKNWEKTFRSKKLNEGDKAAFTDLDQGRKKSVEDAVAGLSDNAAFSEFAEEHGHPLVIFRRAEKGNSAMAEYRGAIHVYDKKDAGYGKAFPVSGPFVPGAYSAGEYGGYQSLVRHEYGHQLFSTLSRDQQREWQQEYLKIDKEKASRELTRYSTTNAEEMFCEVFAAATEPDAALPQWAGDLHRKQRQWLLRGSRK
jgi:hypothetical protein